MSEITVATLLWDVNDKSASFSQCYSEEWVEKLYRGFARKLSRPMRFICFTEKEREFSEPIEQMMIEGKPSYASCIQPYKLDKPMILVGLDTIVTGNCDELADYCFYGDRVAVPIDPFYPDKVCNGVALVPAGQKAIIYDPKPADMNDMEWIRAQSVAKIDQLFPGQVRSYKGGVMHEGVGEARIVYFHGEKKPHELAHVGFVKRHWI
jgi:hypothetical protein